MNVRQVLEVLQRTDRIEKWTLHTDYSYNVVNTWTNPIDVLFIDGNHNYEAVKQDFTQWFPKIKFGGIILFHDSRKEAGTPRETFNRGWEGPTQLAKELLDDHRLKLIEEAFSLTVWKKIHD
jgi:predicted O-methyltransferase YrrM